LTDRLKPRGEELKKFIALWNVNNHVGKLALCDKYSIKYDTARHWVCAGVEAELEEAPVEDASLEMPEFGREILAMKSAVNLDFVTFDIETTNLTADFSIMLCACIKPFGGMPVVFRGDDYPAWVTKKSDDSGIITDVANELRKHAIIVTHYGSGFDVPYMQAKMIKYGLPALPPMFGVDTYRIAKSNMRVASRRLQSLCNYLEIGVKSPVEGNLWLKAAMEGRREDIDAIVEHNIVDCEVLERLASVLFPYLRSIKRL